MYRMNLNESAFAKKGFCQIKGSKFFGFTLNRHKSSKFNFDRIEVLVIFKNAKNPKISQNFIIRLEGKMISSDWRLFYQFFLLDFVARLLSTNGLILSSQSFAIRFRTVLSLLSL